nr:RNA-directed DNA polymerase, eukaryota, reverse transcriptase zinc-binding domain protein [Tanacetum cinerariifolium]
GIQDGDKKISWIKWAKVLASKDHGGLGFFSFYALNKALLLKWVWRFLSRDNSLWFRTIHAIYGSQEQGLSAAFSSNWSSIIKEVKVLYTQGIDFTSHCKIKVGNGRSTSFWKDLWIGDTRLCHKFPRLFALDVNKEGTVASKLSVPLSFSFRRDVRGGAESEQLSQCLNILGSVVLSNSEDRDFWDLNGDGEFCVKDIRLLLDDAFHPKDDSPTRWVKSIPIKINIFAWKSYSVGLQVVEPGLASFRFLSLMVFLEERQSVSSHQLKMKGYIDNLERLGYPVTLGLILSKVQKVNKHKKSQPQMAVRGQNQGNEKNKLAYAPKPKIPLPPKREDPAKDSICHECDETGYWKKNCPRYLSELLKKKKQSQGASNSGFKGK